MKESFYYNNAEQYSENLYSNFPLIPFDTPDLPNASCMMHRFRINGVPDYLMLGKITVESLTEKASEYKSFAALFDEILSTNDIEEKESLIRQLKQHSFYGNITFTQEAFDLLTGKHLFTNGIIERTVVAGTYPDGNGISFDSSCALIERGKHTKTVNEKSRISEIGLFDTLEKYEQNYFVNSEDFERMSPIDAARYAEANYQRIINYLNNNYPSYMKNISMIPEFSRPEEKVIYMAQVLDVLHNAQMSNKAGMYL